MSATKSWCFGPGVAVEGEPEEAHVGVVGGVDDGRVDEVAVLVVGEDALVVAVQVAAVRGIGEEVAGARRDVDPAVADGDPERMARRRRAGEDRDRVARRACAARRPSRPSGRPRCSAPTAATLRTLIRMPSLAAHRKPSSLRARLACPSRSRHPDDEDRRPNRHRAGESARRAGRGLSHRSEAAVRALGAAGDTKDHDQRRVVIDQVDHPQIADPESPELRAGELHRPGWTRLPARARIGPRSLEAAPGGKRRSWR